MLDFYRIQVSKKGKALTVWPDFDFGDYKDIMVRGGSFYAVWNEKTGLWSTNELDVVRIIDEDLYAKAEELKENGESVKVLPMHRNSSKMMSAFKRFVSNYPDNFVQLDSTVTFANTPVSKDDYVSKRLSYPLVKGPINAFDSLFGTLYDESNLEKLMWAIGSIVSGDSRWLQKFYVLYGPPGTGKSTALNLLELLFDGYTTAFEAAAMAKSNYSFPLAPFKDNPLVAIDHEGDLSSISTNSVLTSVVSHDAITMNAKYKDIYTLRLITALFIATNKPVKITDANSGLIRRLLDIVPTGITVPEKDYNALWKRLSFELGGIAHKCLDIYKQLGPEYYNRYTSEVMLSRTNLLYNFVQEYAYEFARDDMITLKAAWDMYKEYCDEVQIKYPMNRIEFRDELREYWYEYHDRKQIGDEHYRSLFLGFKEDAFDQELRIKGGVPTIHDWLILTEQKSAFDIDHAYQPAQLANSAGTPNYKWDDVKTELKDIDTTEIHYVLPKSNHIVIDLDLTDEDGQKSLLMNVAAARKFPPTYVEVSKGGAGLHLHYEYEGDVEELSSVYSDGIEIKKPIGRSSIRRRLSLCNGHDISKISGGLPLKPQKGDTSMGDVIGFKNEQTLKTAIARALMREYHQHTRPTIDLIAMFLREAYQSGMAYDVTDLQSKVTNFAAGSTNQKQECLRIVSEMKFRSEGSRLPTDDRLVFYDVEVFPNLFIVCWAYYGSDDIVEMINPTPNEMSEFIRLHKLVGFNNRRYDNHIVYARALGKSIEELYELSQRIIVDNDLEARYMKAYAISYTDVYDFSSLKKRLKLWEIDLGIFHQEWHHPWDEPVPEELWEEAASYCANDVRATMAVFDHLQEDFRARQILAELSGLTVNDKTINHVAAILFGKDGRYPDYETGQYRHKIGEFHHPDLSEEFPGYRYVVNESEDGSVEVISSYKDVDVIGEGGWVYAEPGMYNNVLYMDVASMHPASLINMNLFGKYTKKFEELRDARILIKEGRLDEAGRMFDGRLGRFLSDSSEAEGLSYALKIILNSVYGYTSASWENPFTHPDNVDNVVAKRGSLFMVDLRDALRDRGSRPIHFKTDSVKIADFNEDDISFVKEFAKRYGYEMAVEGVFERMVLVNKAVLAGKWRDKDGWDAVGAEFIEPYVFKKLFSNEEIEFDDLVITASVQDAKIYLESDNGELGVIGSVGRFCPMTNRGGALYRIDAEGNQGAVAGTKDYKWLPALVVLELGLEDDIDISYFDAKVDEAKLHIAEFGDVEMFLKGD